MYIENNVTKKQLSFWLALMFWIISLMIVVGGLTRLTDSGLSITQWELFSGFLPPLNDDKWIDYFDQYFVAHMSLHFLNQQYIYSKISL